MWLYWAKVARAHADLAERAVTPEAVVDACSASLAGMEAEAPNPPQSRDSEEMLAAMISVAAAAHALDGLYGSVKPLLSLPPSCARRSRRIIEALTAGFRVGKQAPRWQAEVDWLFDSDEAVHPAEVFRPLVVSRVTAHTVVYSGIEVATYSAAAARRAADLASTVITACLDNPKPATKDWAETRRDIWQSVLGSTDRPSASGLLYAPAKPVTVASRSRTP
jgi:hypothetical protein